MVRETRYLWIGNLPESITEDRINEHFSRYGKVQTVKLLPRTERTKPSAKVAFMDIKSASKARDASNEIDGVTVIAEYNESLVQRPTECGGAAAGEGSSRGSGQMYTASTPANKNCNKKSAVDGLPDFKDGGSHNSNRTYTASHYGEDDERGRPKKRTTGATANKPSVSKPGSSSQTFGQREYYESQSKNDDSSERKPLGICIRSLPLRSSDTSLRDGLFHEYKKYGKVTSVDVFENGQKRYAIVSFRKVEDADEAYEASKGKMFFGAKITVETHEGYELDDTDLPSSETEMDEFHSKATRTLFIGNLEKDVTVQTLDSVFKSYGEILDIDIKYQGAVSPYGFVQYTDISSVVRALNAMEGKHIGNNRVKLGFGKSMPSSTVWIDGVADNITDKWLIEYFSHYGKVNHCCVDKKKGRALIFYSEVEQAHYAVSDIKGSMISKKKIQVDYASHDCETAFFKVMESTNQMRPSDRPTDLLQNRNFRPGTNNFQQQNRFHERYNSNVNSPRDNERDAGFDPRASSGSFSGSYSGNQLATPNNSRNRASSYSSHQNTFSRQQSNSRSGMNRFYENSAQDSSSSSSRRQRHFDEYSSEGGAGDDFEQELRRYEQQEQRDRGESYSPPCERRRMRRQSPGDRYMDDRYTDSTSIDKESVRSLRSIRSDRRIPDDDSSKNRAYSPTNSYSSRSASPQSSMMAKAVRNHSPVSSYDGYSQSSKNSAQDYELLSSSGRNKLDSSSKTLPDRTLGGEIQANQAKQLAKGSHSKKHYTNDDDYISDHDRTNRGLPLNAHLVKKRHSESVLSVDDRILDPEDKLRKHSWSSSYMDNSVHGRSKHKHSLDMGNSLPHGVHHSVHKNNHTAVSSDSDTADSDDSMDYRSNHLKKKSHMRHDTGSNSENDNGIYEETRSKKSVSKLDASASTPGGTRNKLSLSGHDSQLSKSMLSDRAKYEPLHNQSHDSIRTKSSTVISSTITKTSHQNHTDTVDSIDSDCDDSSSQSKVYNSVNSNSLNSAANRTKGSKDVSNMPSTHKTEPQVLQSDPRNSVDYVWKRHSTERSRFEIPMMLPLPKFARSLQSPKESPAQLTSPKISSPQLSPAILPKVASPPFSPGCSRPPSPTHFAMPKDPEPKTPTNKDIKADIKLKLSLDSSDSEHSDLGSPSFNERIEALDKVMNSTGVVKKKSTDGTASVVDYREKYKIKKKTDPPAATASPVAANVAITTESIASNIAKSIMSRPSIFDQDTKRLGKIKTKYEPKLGVTLPSYDVDTDFMSQHSGSQRLSGGAENISPVSQLYHSGVQISLPTTPLSAPAISTVQLPTCLTPPTPQSAPPAMTSPCLGAEDVPPPPPPPKPIMSTIPDIKPTPTTSSILRKSIELSESPGILRKSIELAESPGILRKSMELTDSPGLLRKSTDAIESSGRLRNSIELSDSPGVLRKSIDLSEGPQSQPPQLTAELEIPSRKDSSPLSVLSMPPVLTAIKKEENDLPPDCDASAPVTPLNSVKDKSPSEAAVALKDISDFNFFSTARRDPRTPITPGPSILKKNSLTPPTSILGKRKSTDERMNESSTDTTSSTKEPAAATSTHIAGDVDSSVKLHSTSSHSEPEVKKAKITKDKSSQDSKSSSKDKDRKKHSSSSHSTNKSPDKKHHHKVDHHHRSDHHKSNADHVKSDHHKSDHHKADLKSEHAADTKIDHHKSEKSASKSSSSHSSSSKSKEPKEEHSKHKDYHSGTSSNKSHSKDSKSLKHSHSNDKSKDLDKKEKDRKNSMTRGKSSENRSSSSKSKRDESMEFNDDSEKKVEHKSHKIDKHHKSAIEHNKHMEKSKSEDLSTMKSMEHKLDSNKIKKDDHRSNSISSMSSSGARKEKGKSEKKDKHGSSSSASKERNDKKSSSKSTKDSSRDKSKDKDSSSKKSSSSSRNKKDDERRKSSDKRDRKKHTSGSTKTDDRDSSHRESSTGGGGSCNNEIDEDELAMLAPFLSMYDMVKRRSSTLKNRQQQEQAQQAAKRSSEQRKAQAIRQRRASKGMSMDSSSDSDSDSEIETIKKMTGTATKKKPEIKKPLWSYSSSDESSTDFSDSPEYANKTKEKKPPLVRSNPVDSDGDIGSYKKKANKPSIPTPKPRKRLPSSPSSSSSESLPPLSIIEEKREKKPEKPKVLKKTKESLPMSKGRGNYIYSDSDSDDEPIQRKPSKIKINKKASIFSDTESDSDDILSMKDKTKMKPLRALIMETEERLASPKLPKQNDKPPKHSPFDNYDNVNKLYDKPKEKITSHNDAKVDYKAKEQKKKKLLSNDITDSKSKNKKVKNRSKDKDKKVSSDINDIYAFSEDPTPKPVPIISKVEEDLKLQSKIFNHSTVKSESKSNLVDKKPYIDHDKSYVSKDKHRKPEKSLDSEMKSVKKKKKQKKKKHSDNAKQGDPLRGDNIFEMMERDDMKTSLPVKVEEDLRSDMGTTIIDGIVDIPIEDVQEDIEISHVQEVDVDHMKSGIDPTHEMQFAHDEYDSEIALSEVKVEEVQVKTEDSYVSSERTTNDAVIEEMLDMIQHQRIPSTGGEWNEGEDDDRDIPVEPENRYQEEMDRAISSILPTSGPLSKPEPDSDLPKVETVELTDEIASSVSVETEISTTPQEAQLALETDQATQLLLCDNSVPGMVDEGNQAVQSLLENEPVVEDLLVIKPETSNESSVIEPPSESNSQQDNFYSTVLSESKKSSSKDDQEPIKTPVKSRDPSPTKPHVPSPTKHRDSSPTKPRDTPSAKSRDTSPTKPRDTLPSKHRDPSSTKPLDLPSTKPLDLPSTKPLDLPSTKPWDLLSTTHQDVPPTKPTNLSSTNENIEMPSDVVTKKHKKSKGSKRRSSDAPKEQASFNELPPSTQSEVLKVNLFDTLENTDQKNDSFDFKRDLTGSREKLSGSDSEKSNVFSTPAKIEKRSTSLLSDKASSEDGMFSCPTTPIEKLIIKSPKCYLSDKSIGEYSVYSSSDKSNLKDDVVPPLTIHKTGGIFGSPLIETKSYLSQKDDSGLSIRTSLDDNIRTPSALSISERYSYDMDEDDDEDGLVIDEGIDDIPEAPNNNNLDNIECSNKETSSPIEESQATKEEKRPKRAARSKSKKIVEDEDDFTASRDVHQSPARRTRQEHKDSTESLPARTRKAREDDCGGTPKRVKRDDSSEGKRARASTMPNTLTPPMSTEIEKLKQRPRRSSGRYSRDEEMTSDKDQDESLDNQEEIVTRGRRTPRRKVAPRRPGLRGSDKETDVSESEVKDDEDELPKTPRRGRKGRKVKETGMLSPKAKSDSGTHSPRAKLVDPTSSTSPLSAVVKLEKLNMLTELTEKPSPEKDDQESDSARHTGGLFSRRIGQLSSTKESKSKNKDIFAWEDDEEDPKPLPELHKRPRKKAEDKKRSLDEPIAEDPKRSKLDGKQDNTVDSIESTSTKPIVTVKSSSVVTSEAATTEVVTASVSCTSVSESTSTIIHTNIATTSAHSAMPMSTSTATTAADVEAVKIDTFKEEHLALKGTEIVRQPVTSAMATTATTVTSSSPITANVTSAIATTVTTSSITTKSTTGSETKTSTTSKTNDTKVPAPVVSTDGLASVMAGMLRPSQPPPAGSTPPSRIHHPVAPTSISSTQSNSTMSNMERVIDQVAKGGYEILEDFQNKGARPRSRSRDDVPLIPVTGANKIPVVPTKHQQPQARLATASQQRHAVPGGVQQRTGTMVLPGLPSPTHPQAPHNQHPQGVTGAPPHPHTGAPAPHMTQLQPCNQTGPGGPEKGPLTMIPGQQKGLGVILPPRSDMDVIEKSGLQPGQIIPPLPNAQTPGMDRGLPSLAGVPRGTTPGMTFRPDQHQRQAPHGVRGQRPEVAYAVGQPAGAQMPGVLVSQSTTSTKQTQQTSELRAALAQPSKLQQQEQILQLQQSQPRGVAAPRVQPSTEQVQSPAQHRLPANIHDRMAQPTRGAPEPKMAAKDSTRPQPSMPGHTGDVRLPVEGLPAHLPTQLFPDFRMQHPGGNIVYPPHLMPPHLRPHLLPGQEFIPAPTGHPAAVHPSGHPPGHPHMVLAQPPFHPAGGADYTERTASGGRPPSRSASQPSPRATPTPAGQISPAIPHHVSPHLPPGGPLAAGGPLVPPGGAPPPNRTQQPASTDPSHVSLVARYPVVWQGRLALKNDSANVQMHFLAGNKNMIKNTLPQMGQDGTLNPLRIAQRMRLEATQLESVAKHMTNNNDYCMLVAIPCGLDQDDVTNQTKSLDESFLKYLQYKSAAGICNIPGPNTNTAAYVVHVFPPCEFSHTNLQRAPDLLANIQDIAYLLIVIATC